MMFRLWDYSLLIDFSDLYKKAYVFTQGKNWEQNGTGSVTTRNIFYSLKEEV